MYDVAGVEPIRVEFQKEHLLVFVAVALCGLELLLI
jgi:hypothetical protein